MTDDKHFKRLVRQRAQESGEKYTTARASLRPTAEGPSPGPQLERFRSAFEAVVETVDTRLLGRHGVVTVVAAATFVGGAVLFTDPPGVGQTALVRGVASAIGGAPIVIDGVEDLTPDDLPAWTDADVVLVNYLERVPRRSLPALFSRLPRPALLIAKCHGTDPSRAPLDLDVRDRFLIGLNLGYADAETEARLLDLVRSGSTLAPPTRTLDLASLTELRGVVSRLPVPTVVRDQAVAVVRATREDPDVVVGGSMNATLSLVSMASVMAAAARRQEVSSDDLGAVLAPVLGHRLELRREASLDGVLQRAASTAGVAGRGE